MENETSATKEIPFNRSMLRWARREANLTPGLAAARAHIKDLKKKGALEAIPSALRLERWEEGPDTPTFRQLEELAKAYRRPVLTFFLSQPPRKEKELADFRIMANRADDIMLHQPEFSALVRQTQATQKSVRQILIETGRAPLRYVASVKLATEHHIVANEIALALGLDRSRPPVRSRVRDPFSFLRRKAEEIGVFTLLQGNLGSVHTNMGSEVFRGFTLSDDIAPFIVINPNDTKTANLFTLAHELCHVWLGDAAVSNWISLDPSQPTPDSEEEVFCDNVAAEFLVPRRELLKQWTLYTIGYDTQTVIARIARNFAVSPIVVARRLHTFQLMSRDEYWGWYNDYQDQWIALQEERKASERNPPGYATRTKSKLGRALITTVIEASRQGTISELEASHILNVKLDNFSKLL